MGSPGAWLCNFSATSTKEANITNYKCVFRHDFEVTGSLNKTITDENRPLHWSNIATDFKTCTGHEIFYGETAEFGGNNMTLILENCVGHKLKTGDFRNQELPHVKKGKVLTPNEYNVLIDTLKWQITERFKSNKYKTIYINNFSDTVNKAKDMTASYNKDDVENGKNPKAYYNAELKNLIDSIKKLLPSGNYNTYFLKHDSYPELQAILDVDPLPTNVTFTTPPKTGIRQVPTLSYNNMEAIRTTIAHDLNDCICYSDCNGYSVCWCYGNCNHY